LLEQGTQIRLCKGAYNEPPEVAFPKKSDVDANFDRLAALMIDASKAQGSVPASADGKIPPITALGTHDEKRTVIACKHGEEAGLPKEALEFQMLYGIRSDLQDALHARGYPVRVYVPFGTEWYPYFMRRLAERPANLWFFLTALFRG
ncbi:MAG: proline dehydrogenase family protein, partial [Anaerolineales bacterium]|nr:proline dehydrogenase family protein [Anaerolineales bacterium]